MNEKPKIDRYSTARVLTFVALITVALSASVYLLETHIESKRTQIEIQKRLDAIRAAGQPVTAQDLAKLYPDPPSEHDAVLLLQPPLSALVVPEDSTKLPFFGAALPTGTALFEKSVRDETQLWMDQNQKAFDSVPLEKLKGAWIGSGFSGGFTNFIDVPKSKINSLVRLLCLNAVLQAESKHSGAAINSLQRALAVGAIWQNDSPIDLLLRTFEEKAVCESLEYIINHSQLSNEELMTIEQSLPRDNTKGLMGIFISERCFQIWQMERVGKNLKMAAKLYGGKTRDRASFWFDSITGKIYCDSDFALLLDRSTQRILATELPFKQCMDKLESLKPGIDADGRPASFALVFAEGNRNIYPRYALGSVEGIAYLRIIHTTLVVERWRLANDGRLPDSLAELVPDFLPAIPTDPFDEQPLRYKKLTHGYVIYSIGPDSTDDGGKEKPADAKDTAHYDITFTVER